jgi:hypothetical protein
VGTIQKRTRKDGSSSYTATVRVKRDGKVVLSLSETFARRPMAATWIKRKEAEADAPGGVERLKGGKLSGVTVGDAIDRYTEATANTFGRSKTRVLKALRADPIANVDCAEVTSKALVDLAQRLKPGRKPQTVMEYMSGLQGVKRVRPRPPGMGHAPRSAGHQGRHDREPQAGPCVGE